jgi:hypothetical protein
MNELINVYCDESCHLENDHQPVMVLGAIWCPAEKTREVAEEIRAIKHRHGVPPFFEIKWTKVSPAKLPFYQELLDYFFTNPDLHFRALIASKIGLTHEEYVGGHNTWYYKLYFDMLKIIFSPLDQYRIYVDIKDTRGGAKIRKLHEVLSNSLYDFSREIIQHIQIVQSKEIEQMQLADLLIGIVSSANRDTVASEAKRTLIEQMRQQSGYSLTLNTLYRELKVNLFHWQPKGMRD